MIRVHVGGAGQPGEQHRGADDVEHVIDVVAVTRPLDEADTCEGAIEAVAEPVHGQCHDDHPDRARVDTQQPIADARGCHRAQRQTGEVIRMDPRWETPCNPDPAIAFGAGDTLRCSQNMVRHYSPQTVTCKRTEDRLTNPDTIEFA